MYAPDGRRHQGHRAPPTGARAAAAARRAVDLYLEAASNPDVAGGWGWAPTPLGDLATAGDDPLYRLGAVELA